MKCLAHRPFRARLRGVIKRCARRVGAAILLLLSVLRLPVLLTGIGVRGVVRHLFGVDVNTQGARDIFHGRRIRVVLAISDIGGCSRVVHLVHGQRTNGKRREGA